MLRRARLEDLDACFAAQRAADTKGLAHIFPPERFPFPEDAVRERWRSNLTDERAWCVLDERDGLVAGVAVSKGDHFDAIAVDPVWWGTDVAPSLHDAVLGHAREEGHEQMHLWVIEENRRARRFYEKYGWSLDGRKAPAPYEPNPPMVGYSLRFTNR